MKLFSNNHTKTITSDYAEFSRTAKSSDRKKVIKAAIRQANKMQRRTAN